MKNTNPNSPENYAKSMAGAYKNAEKTGTLGRGFGGIAPVAKKPSPMGSVKQAVKQIAPSVPAAAKAIKKVAMIAKK